VRILHVNKFLYRRGGAEAYMFDLASAQRGAGHEVEFYGMSHPSNEPQRFDSEFPAYLEMGGVEGGISDRIRIAARTVYSSSARRGIDTVCDRFAPDVAHLHNIYHQLSPSILAPLAARGIPIVMTLHDYKLACPTYRFLADGVVCEACLDGDFRNALYKRCNKGSTVASAVVAAESRIHRTFKTYGKVTRFVCPSEFMMSKMVEADVFPDRMCVIPNFAPVESIEPAGRPGGPLAFVGRLASEKGVDTLIRAAAIGGFSVQIAGDGPERAALEDLATRLGASVRFVGHLSPGAVHELLRGSTASVLPARWYENQPISVIESFAAGIPVIATDIGGLPELVRPGETGTLVPVDDPGALAAAAQQYLSDPDMAATVGRRARALAEAEFTAEAHLGRIEALYEDLGAGALAREGR
jgi:glycosyltransferase involved in cell wall biosynthesis